MGQRYKDKRDRESIRNFSGVDWSSADLDTYIELVHPLQGELGHLYPNEVELLVNTLSPKELRIMIEVGTMFGTSTRLFAALAKQKDAKLYAIDGDMVIDRLKYNLEVMGVSDCVDLIQCWNPWFDFIPEWEQLNYDVDFLFIDGDHTFMSVIVDYHYFNYYLAQDGIVAFHDTDLKEVRDAIDVICKRDPLEFVGEAERLTIYKKLSPSREAYFERIRKPKC